MSNLAGSKAEPLLLIGLKIEGGGFVSVTTERMQITSDWLMTFTENLIKRCSHALNLPNRVLVTAIYPQTMISELHNIHPHRNFTFETMVNNQMLFLDGLVIIEGNIWKYSLIKKQNTIHSLHL